MSKAILGHPYSGALYAYIADQLMPGNSHTSAIGNHPYYTTLYGRNHKHYVERALMFSILYDDIYLTPADNPWPKSLLSDSRSFHPELGLHADWDEYQPLFGDEDGNVSNYLSDPYLQSILSDKFKIPPGSWTMILSSILYEYCLSRQYRCPILCSPGRRIILDRLVEIDLPAIHPTTVPDLKLDATQAYMGITGLVLSPTSLEDMSYVKTDAQVRAYAFQFLRMLEEFRLNPDENIRKKILLLARNAIDTAKIGKYVIGALDWASTLFKLVGAKHHLGVVTLGGKKLANYLTAPAAWQAFSGEVKKVQTNAELARHMDEELGK